MDDVGQLINLAGARESVPEERYKRVRQNVLNHWQTTVAEQVSVKAPIRFRALGLAASLVTAVMAIVLLWDFSIVPDTLLMANVERVLGEVKIANDIAVKGRRIGADIPIVTSDDSRIALRMSGGQSLRIDTSSHVVIHSPDRISLQSGAIYIDTSSAEKATPIHVSTPLGAAQDIGTQFQVRLSGMVMVVGVRQGLVEVSRVGQQSHSVQKGQFIKLDSSGEIDTYALASDDPEWKWIETVAPEFDIQAKSLESYLAWFAQERGINLDWADEKSKSSARATMLSGSIAGSSLEEGLLLVQQIAPFEYRLSDDSLWVKVK